MGRHSNPPLAGPNDPVYKLGLIVSTPRSVRSSTHPTKPSSHNHETTLDLTDVGYDGRGSQEGKS